MSALGAEYGGPPRRRPTAPIDCTALVLALTPAQARRLRKFLDDPEQGDSLRLRLPWTQPQLCAALAYFAPEAFSDPPPPQVASEAVETGALVDEMMLRRLLGRHLYHPLDEMQLRHRGGGRDLSDGPEGERPLNLRRQNQQSEGGDEDADEDRG